MFTAWRVYFFIGFIILFSGCTQKNLEKNVPVSKNIQKKETKEYKKYKYCNKHEEIMTFASNYIQEEFKKAYFSSNDTVGAKAQLFLIEKNSPTAFAKNINAARESYNSQYLTAKENGCNIEEFKIFPLEKIKNIIKKLEEEQNK
ncbi:hypothetical protein [Halarcobacter anaerophilus]|uniref:Lipoprotein n=1 Tax=Halarcobacter anaerophilus TaxID=877500 RepID=A0A4Q0XZB8_9BACT|nr:hypothetical protein [Halarcobacter anaerophilus]QDF28150.1 hypothetical protein AANAER_0648 [Halarcobacter anaerophilus]RXJ62495.1 hypothetical protein CRV06_10160 [Halarcobacter anaerophilus]